MAQTCKILAGVSVFFVLLLLLISSDMKNSVTFSGYIYMPLETSKSSSKSPPTNSLQDLEVYVRYTTVDPEFPKQAEAWIFRSISLFWPKNTKVVVVLDKENAVDRAYGSTIMENTFSQKITLKVCYMETYPPEIIHHWGKMRVYMDMMHADFCTNATYVGLAHVDTLFTTAVTPNLLLEAGKPVVTGTIGEPGRDCWMKTGEFVLGVKQVMQCTHYFPVTFKTCLLYTSPSPRDA